MSLAELEKYINREGHSPGFPSAEEIAAKGGVSVAETQLSQQIKLEEHDLYLIDIDKRLRKLEKEDAKKEKIIAKLEKEKKIKDEKIKKLKEKLAVKNK